MNYNTTPKTIYPKKMDECLKLEPIEISIFLESNNISTAASLEWLLDADKKKIV
ncbi:MAG: hypothetical protein ACJZ8Q_00385 [Paracoccaceae bacterium]